MKEEELNNLIEDKKYTFSQGISKRLKFISILMAFEEFNEEKIKQVINNMWEELIVNSFINLEMRLFGQWFSNFTQFLSNHLENNNILEEFFR